LLETLKTGNGNIDYSRFGILFLQEAVGGVVAGLVLGYALHLLLKSINHYETEILLTLAFVMSGYGLCAYLHVSGPLAMVVMGLLVGNYKQNEAMSNTTEDYVSKFWEVVDVILNAVLFILIAFVIVIIEFKMVYVYAGLITIVIALLSRWGVIYLPKVIFPKIANITNKEVKLIVWGGLRGGLSIALVLSLPDSEAKKIILIITYICVLFSIIVQGLTIDRLAKKVKALN
jgi:NhaP-type Na+/H+ and K+/H+ antiporters